MRDPARRRVTWTCNREVDTDQEDHRHHGRERERREESKAEAAENPSDDDVWHTMVAIDRDGVTQHAVNGLQIPRGHGDGDEDLRVSRLDLGDVFEVIVSSLGRWEEVGMS
jgi:hypothetical protein